MNGEKPGRQAVKGEATEVPGGKWRAAVPRHCSSPSTGTTACSFPQPSHQLAPFYHLRLLEMAVRGFWFLGPLE